MAGVAGLCFTPPSKLTCVPAGCPLGKSLFKPPSRLRLCKVPRGGWLVARFGSGGYKPRPAGVPRRSSGKSRFVDSDYDQALDLDRIQSPSVRLLDEQQNMVGIVSKGEAIRIAEDAELILRVAFAVCQNTSLHCLAGSFTSCKELRLSLPLSSYNSCVSMEKLNLKIWTTVQDTLPSAVGEDPSSSACRCQRRREWRFLESGSYWESSDLVSMRRTEDRQYYPLMQILQCSDCLKVLTTTNRMDTKELKMGYNIDSHDYSVRLKAAQKFLKDGDKVKVIVNLKGRENEFKNIAIELIKRFQNDVGELATEESKSFSERNIYLILTPNKAALQKVQEQPKKETSAAAEVSASV
ncbi:Translation initiation factor IF-3, chloroplastic [Dendrobium catenatum]|uniref:Translation initiation factor IF-3, chloroplastic n=1 Tax=Dendrobium catenatum TaxID=906689 RepID=A0A2I0WSX2_9ASPA|nr:Translation initiation factor IF-3, chloroplastic [Dendrobium catenatum]